MSLFTSIATNHEDLIHHISYNSFGTRLATCSLDQSIRVYDIEEGTGEFRLTADWKVRARPLAPIFFPLSISLSLSLVFP